MTTVNGTFAHCSNGDTSFRYVCEGPSCYGIAYFPDRTCTNNTDATFVSCTNGITCSGLPLFSSNFTLNQNGCGVEQLDTYSVNGDQFVSRPKANPTAPSPSANQWHHLRRQLVNNGKFFFGKFYISGGYKQTRGY